MLPLLGSTVACDHTAYRLPARSMVMGAKSCPTVTVLFPLASSGALKTMLVVHSVGFIWQSVWPLVSVMAVGLEYPFGKRTTTIALELLLASPPPMILPE